MSLLYTYFLQIGFLWLYLGLTFTNRHGLSFQAQNCISAYHFAVIFFASHRLDIRFENIRQKNRYSLRTEKHYLRMRTILIALLVSVNKGQFLAVVISNPSTSRKQRKAGLMTHASSLHPLFRSNYCEEPRRKASSLKENAVCKQKAVR